MLSRLNRLTSGPKIWYRDVPKILASDTYMKLKADRPPTRNYPPTPTDYRHTDKHLRLVTGELGHTNGQTDGRTLPITLSPRFAVDNEEGLCGKNTNRKDTTQEGCQRSGVFMYCDIESSLWSSKSFCKFLYRRGCLEYGSFYFFFFSILLKWISIIWNWHWAYSINK